MGFFDSAGGKASEDIGCHMSSFHYLAGCLVSGDGPFGYQLFSSTLDITNMPNAIAKPQTSG